MTGASSIERIAGNELDQLFVDHGFDQQQGHIEVSDRIDQVAEFALTPVLV